MKKIILSFAVGVFSLSPLLAQQNLLPPFSNPVIVNCPFDSTVHLQTFAGWLAYQTIDDNWDGPVDSTKCFSLYDVAFSTYLTIQASEVDMTRRVFIKLDSAATAQFYLDSNAVYKAYFGMYTLNNGLTIDYSNDCDNSLCSYLVTNLEIPDSSFTGYEDRIVITDLPYGYRDYCFPTEYFPEGNRLKNLVIAIKLSGDPTNKKLYIPNAEMHQIGYEPEYQSSLVKIYPWDAIQPSSSSSYYFGHEPPWVSEFAYLFTHDTTYPQVSNITYYDFAPFPNTPQPQVIDIYFQYDVTLHVQRFVSFRGGLVEGDSVLRHTFNLYNDGNDMCLGGLYEFTFENNSRFVYNSGNLDFSEQTSCFGFGKGGSLNVSEGATLHYGSASMGMMLFKTGGTINIAKNAELVIHNTLIMYEYPDDPGPQQIYMTLNEGAKLTFAPGSRVVNMFSKDNTIKLNIFMKGGEVDLSELSPEDRLLVNLIYDVPSSSALDNLILYNQPSKDELRFSMVFGAAEAVPFSVFDMDGRLVKSITLDAGKGIQFFDVPLAGLSSGTYVLQFSDGDKMLRRKFLKL